MSFIINRTLAVKTAPFQKGLDLIILEKVESMLRAEKHNPYITLFSVNYNEIKSNKSGVRFFYIKEAYNQRDKA